MRDHEKGLASHGGYPRGTGRREGLTTEINPVARKIMGFS